MTSTIVKPHVFECDYNVEVTWEEGGAQKRGIAGWFDLREGKCAGIVVVDNDASTFGDVYAWLPDGQMIVGKWRRPSRMLELDRILYEKWVRVVGISR